MMSTQGKYKTGWKKNPNVKGAGLARSCTNPGSPSETWPHGHFIQIGFLLEGKQTFYSSHKRAACQYGYLAGIPVATISSRTMLPHLSFVSAPSAFRFFFHRWNEQWVQQRNFGADLPWNTNALEISTGDHFSARFFCAAVLIFINLLHFICEFLIPPPPVPDWLQDKECVILKPQSSETFRFMWIWLMNAHSANVLPQDALVKARNYEQQFFFFFLPMAE